MRDRGLLFCARAADWSILCRGEKKYGKRKEMTTQPDYDLVVIGSGPAGEKGAAQAAYFGKKVALRYESARANHR